MAVGLRSYYLAFNLERQFEMQSDSSGQEGVGRMEEGGGGRREREGSRRKYRHALKSFEGSAHSYCPTVKRNVT